MKSLYEMLDKRLSIRKKVEGLNINNEDLEKINLCIEKLKALTNDIIDYKIVKADETNSKIGEYEILVYSKKTNSTDYLINIGYMFEQLDLYLESINIGVCWLGIPRPNKKIKNELDYVIMLGITKIDNSYLRKDANDFKRKEVDNLWKGLFNNDVKEKSLLAPSACNSQCWLVESDEAEIKVYRNKKNKTIIPRSFLNLYNSIDMGIYLCFLEVCLQYHNYDYNREFINKDIDDERILIAKYNIK